MNILQPAPFIPEIEDKEEVKKIYPYWRLRIFYSTCFGYALYYISRKSYVVAMPGLIADLGYDMSQLGILLTVFSLAYGVSKFTSGILSDKINPRYFMAMGLMFSGLANIFFGLTSSLIVLAIIWGFNGWFQGFGAPPCARFLTQWYSQSERGRWWSMWNISHNLGSSIVPWIVGPCLILFGWRYAMFLPGIICILGSLFLINRLRDTPQSLGLPPIEKFRDDYAGQSKAEVNDTTVYTAWELITKFIIKNKYIWLLSFAYFFIYIVREGVSQWTALYLINVKDYGKIGANGCVSLFDVGGFLGSLSAGWISDRVFNARRGPVNILFSMMLLGAIFMFWCVPHGYPLLDSASIFCIGFSIFGPQMLIGMSAAEFAGKKAAATATGFAGIFAYMGSAVAGWPLGKLTHVWGWEGFFLGLCVSCSIAILLLLPMWGVKKGEATAPAVA